MFLGEGLDSFFKIVKKIPFIKILKRLCVLP